VSPKKENRSGRSNCDKGSDRSDNRIAGLDCLRGLFLTLVLADHIDFAAYSRGGVRHWTLMGLGFSDAAEGFVFLSGFVFGFVYSRRMQQNGYWPGVRRGMVRALQIYLGFLLAGTTIELMRTTAITGDWSQFLQNAMSMLTLGYQPASTGILALYIALLPWLLVLLPLLRSRFWWMVLSLSAGIYLIVQTSSLHGWTCTLQGWSFQPSSWQLLIVIAAWLGCRFQPEGKSPAWTGWRVLFGLAVVVLVIGLVAKKYEWLPSMLQEPLRQPVTQLNQNIWSGKSGLAPLRLIHFISLAYAVMYLFPLDSRLWSSWWLEWLRVCGRHSLTLYCVGIVMTQAIGIMFRWWGAGRVEVLIATVDALALQVLLALVLDSRYRKFRSMPRP
jgi:hypothetical protein